MANQNSGPRANLRRTASVLAIAGLAMLSCSPAVMAAGDQVNCRKCVDTSDIAKNAVNTSRLKDGAVTNSKIGNGAVNSAKILNGSVTGADLQDGSVGAADLGTNSVGASEIAADAVDAAEIADDAVGASEIADDAVGAGAIAADAVGSSEIAADAVGASEIATGAVGASEIAADAVGASEIATGAVGASEVLDDSLTALDLGDEAGADFLAGSDVALSGADETVLSISITAPSAGVVIVFAQGTFRSSADGDADCSITTGTTQDDDNEIGVTTDKPDSVPFSSSRGFIVSAGTTTFNFVCTLQNKTMTIEDPEMQAIYVPTQY